MVTIWEERLREGAADPSRLKDRVRGCSTGRVSRMRTRIGRVSRLEIVPDLVPSLRERYTLSCPVYLLGVGESLRQEVRARTRKANRVYRAVVIGLVIFIVGVMGMVSLMGGIGLMRALGLAKVVRPARVLCSYAGVGSLGERDRERTLVAISGDGETDTCLVGAIVDDGQAEPLEVIEA